MTGTEIRNIVLPACLTLVMATGLGWGVSASPATAGMRDMTLSQAEPDSGTEAGEDGDAKDSGPRILRPKDAEDEEPDDAIETGAQDAPDTKDGTTARAGDPPYKAPDIQTDLSTLPFAARRMHELLVEAARSGDIEKLRPFIGSGDDVTMLSFGGMEGDPIDFLKSVSGDPQGHEILAILLEILEAGFVHVEAGTPNEMYVWPYFYAVQLDKLTPSQRVELFTLLTYGDYQEMVSFGAYLFYRVGITPQGRWRFFVAGD